jgi:hypothetical protein
MILYMLENVTVTICMLMSTLLCIYNYVLVADAFV